jgi:hypothetical protein
MPPPRAPSLCEVCLISFPFLHLYSSLTHSTPFADQPIVDKTSSAAGADSVEDATIVLIPWPTADPADPLNWSAWRKTACMATVAFYAFVANFISSSMAPALPLWNRAFPHDRRDPHELAQLIAVRNLLFLFIRLGSPLTLLLVQCPVCGTWERLLGSLRQRLGAPARPRPFHGIALCGHRCGIPRPWLPGHYAGPDSPRSRKLSLGNHRAGCSGGPILYSPTRQMDGKLHSLRTL